MPWPGRPKKGDEEYRHVTASVDKLGRRMGRGGTLHFKWDSPGQGNHVGPCRQCRNENVSWTASGKIKE